DLGRDLDPGDTDRHGAVDAASAADVERAGGLEVGRWGLDRHGGGHGPQGDAGAPQERLEQQVTGAGILLRAAGRGVQTSAYRPGDPLDGGGQSAGGEARARPDGHERRVGLGAVLLLQRGLDGPEFCRVHPASLASLRSRPASLPPKTTALGPRGSPWCHTLASRNRSLTRTSALRGYVARTEPSRDRTPCRAQR